MLSEVLSVITRSFSVNIRGAEWYGSDCVQSDVANYEGAGTSLNLPMTVQVEMLERSKQPDSEDVDLGKLGSPPEPIVRSMNSVEQPYEDGFLSPTAHEVHADLRNSD